MLYSSKKNVSKISKANMMINQRNNICKTCNDEIVVENLNCTIFFVTDAAFFPRNADFDTSFFSRFFWIRLASFSFEIDRLFRYWLNASKDILFFFFLKISFWRFWFSSMIETTHCKFSIFLTWKQFKTKSIAKNSKQKRFFFLFFLFQSQRFWRKICLMTKNSNCSSHKDSKHRFLWQSFRQEILFLLSERFRFFSISEQQTITRLTQRQKRQKWANFRQRKQEKNKQTNTKWR
jgi:hypothetical protein